MTDARPRPLPAIFTNIARDADGVWHAAGQTPVSYREGGHDLCHGVEDGSFWFAHRNRCIAAVIARHPPDPALPFVDVGGGNGYVAAMIRALGYRVALVEPGAAGIAHARARGVDELVQASIVDLEVAPGALGAIGMFDVLEHIDDDAAALRSLHGMLAEGGKLYATVPAHRWLWSSADRDAGHFRRYTTGQLRTLFARCGFELDLCSYYFWPLPLPMLLLRSLPERLGRPAARARQDRVASEHRGAGPLLERLLGWERSRLQRGGAVPFGASCILAATKISRG